jgi:hypothetical protein
MGNFDAVAPASLLHLSEYRATAADSRQLGCQSSDVPECVFRNRADDGGDLQHG